MYESTGLKEYTIENKKRLCGIVGGFAVQVTPDGKVGEINLETTAVNGFDNVRNMLFREKFGSFKVVTAMTREQYIEVSVRFANAPQISDWEEAAQKIAELFRQCWYFPKDNCYYCRKTECDSAAHARGTYRAVHRACYEASIEKSVKKSQGRGGAAPLLGAAVGALIVLLMCVAVMLVAHTSYPFIYIFITYLAWMGYTFMRGACGKKAGFIVVGISLCVTLLSELIVGLMDSTGLAGYFAEPSKPLLSLLSWAIGTAVMSPIMFKSLEKIEAQQRSRIDTLIPLSHIDDPE